MRINSCLRSTAAITICLKSYVSKGKNADKLKWVELLEFVKLTPDRKNFVEVLGGNIREHGNMLDNNNNHIMPFKYF